MKEIEEFYNRLLKIKYGWHDKEGRLHQKIEPQIFAKEYKMQAYNKIEESGYAICWELCELERHFFNKVVAKIIFNLFFYLFLFLNTGRKWSFQFEFSKNFNDQTNDLKVLIFFPR